MSAYRVGLRDRLVWRVCNAVLRLATPEYRAFVTVSARRGVEQTLADLRAEREEEGRS